MGTNTSIPPRKLRRRRRASPTTLPDMFRAAFAPINAAFSTLSLPNILSNVANKELLAGFMEEDQSWREVSITRTVGDFKTVTSYRMLDDMEYEELGPDGEIKHDKVSEDTYTRKARTYAKMFSLTRDKIIDDDLGAFEDLRVRLGAGAARSFNNVFWSRFINNATFFTEARGNFIKGAGTALDINVTGLQAGILAFRKLKSPDGKRIGGLPTILLVPTEFQFIAQRMYQSTTVNAGALDGASLAARCKRSGSAHFARVADTLNGKPSLESPNYKRELVDLATLCWRKKGTPEVRILADLLEQYFQELARTHIETMWADLDNAMVVSRRSYRRHRQYSSAKERSRTLLHFDL